jgi:hypothetical protein
VVRASGQRGAGSGGDDAKALAQEVFALVTWCQARYQIKRFQLVRRYMRVHQVHGEIASLAAC